MSITTIARQAQGVRAGEVIAKLAEDAYFMRVKNRVTQVPPSELMNPGTMKLQAAVQQMVDARTILLLYICNCPWLLWPLLTSHFDALDWCL
jgi:hypothetical protein